MLVLCSLLFLYQTIVPCSVLLSTIIGVTTIKKFFTIHYIVSITFPLIFVSKIVQVYFISYICFDFYRSHEKKHKVKDTLTFKCENESITKQWAENIRNALNQGNPSIPTLRNMAEIKQ
jgi:hypothetical protein